MKSRLDMERIARGLGAERRGKVRAAGGFFGALQLMAEIQARFRVPGGGGRPTDPRWTKRRLIPLAARTLARLEKLTARVMGRGGVRIAPMQLAALLLEKSTKELSEDEAKEFVLPKKRASR